ncbi:MAG: DegT/DnrJ/EryC1/StrS family aminotransferase [Pirellulaceae bacterium]
MSDPPLFFAQTSDFQLSPRLQGLGEPVSGYGGDVLVDGSEGTADHLSALGGSRAVTFAAMSGGGSDPSAGTDHGSSRGARHGGRPCSRPVALANTSANPAAWPGGEDLGAGEEEARAASRRIPVLVPDMPPAEMVLPHLRRMDETGWYTNFGPLVGELEERLANRLSGSERDLAIRVATTSSGTMAIELAMAALVPRPGTRIMIPGFNFPAAATAALRLGHEPVLCDVDAAAWILTPEIARAVCRRFEVGLVVPVATFGRPLDVEAWDAFTNETGIPVLIDAAAAFDGQRVGRTTTVVFSFHATKPFGIGEGGLVATTSGRIARRARRLSNFGFVDGVVREAGGGNGKLSEYHAAVGLAQLERWDGIKRRRRALARQYAYELALNGNGVCVQQGWGNFGPANLTVALGEAAMTHGIADKLEAAGIETRRWYCPSLTRHPVFRQLPRAATDGDALDVCESLCQCTLGLPFHGCMTAEDVTTVCRHLSTLIQKP